MNLTTQNYLSAYLTIPFGIGYASCYQGGDRVKINELWVPAAAIVEDGLEDCARVIRQEARHRLRTGEGIRVFSRPELLKSWLESEGLSLESRGHLITDAGNLVGFLILRCNAILTSSTSGTIANTTRIAAKKSVAEKPIRLKPTAPTTPPKKNKATRDISSRSFF
jgi:hypothetical protein